MKSATPIWIGLATIVLLMSRWASAEALAAEPSAANAELFETQVRPLLVDRCLSCHGDEKPKSALKLTSRADILKGGSRGPAVVVGNPDKSLLVQAIRHDGDLRMPPKDKLSDKQIQALTGWVKEGLPWPESSGTLLPAASRFKISDKQRQFWSFQPPRPVAVPSVLGRLQSPIDAFILARLEAKHVTPAAPADKRTLLRRATFDLIGLPPTPDEMDAFLKDNSPEAFAKVVDRLLASPQYGERWGRHWLDVVRYADARDLIQLPPASDFREIWRYRDWVVESFNRDMPYTEFIRRQIAGDLLPPSTKGGINKDGLIATGMLALADFVPGDVDKEQMIADYVNDEIDVVGRGFLGLSLACARCHDHKFDPVSTEDYYALAGIFFSTRLVPEPVPGNTPLVRVPLLSAAEINRAKAQEAADKRRRAEIELQLRTTVDREYLALVKRLISEQTARYLVAASQHRQTKTPLSELAKQKHLQEVLLTKWVEYLSRIEKQPASKYAHSLHDAATEKLAGADLDRAADQLQKSLTKLAKRFDSELPSKSALAQSTILRVRADDPNLSVDMNGRVTLLPNRAPLAEDVKPPRSVAGPMRANATINGHDKQVLRFDGTALLEAPVGVPANGSLFAVFRTSDQARPGQRLVGWEDADVGKHGLGLMVEPGGRIHAILRNNGQSGDVVHAGTNKGFEIVCVTWGAGGTAMFRDGSAVGTSKGIVAISSDPAIRALRIGGPGSGGSPRFRGDVAEIRVYDRQLTEDERKAVNADLRRDWFESPVSKADASDPLAGLYEELLSPRGPFWVAKDQRIKLLPSDLGDRLAGLERELKMLQKKPALEIPQAVVVQDGGPKGTRHEGFRDSPIFVRGDHKRLGKTVPRGFPTILTGDHPPKITIGSGRLQLADWLARSDNPLVARVMVNRIWQHHFGEGLVRTPNDFGARGEPPTHPELLDYLAQRFIESGWSVKAMHRLIMLSNTYQQSSHATADILSKDPENRLLGRFNRQRLDAEAIRDSLLAIAGRLDTSMGGPAFPELSKPQRTLYLLSARTGANTSDFGRIFDRADPGSIVAQRGLSIGAPQALFFLNDPFVNEITNGLAARITRESLANDQAKIGRLYALALGRPPSPTEIELGKQLLAQPGQADSWERYCHLILCTNEFVYVD